MPKYLVEAVSQFRMRYVVEAEEGTHAADAVVMQEVDEFSQLFLGETLTSVWQLEDDEIVELFYQDHEYLAGNPDPERALSYVHKIKY